MLSMITYNVAVGNRDDCIIYNTSAPTVIEIVREKNEQIVIGE